ncbi:VQ motif-containing protein 4 [Camellia lanceoleosa]|nr:VQ motif-containing protein 4 [Camellia lanceoleosa]
METSLKFQENQNPSLIRSPNSHSTNTTSSSSSNSSSNGLHHHHHHHPSSLPPPPPTPTTPTPPITRSNPTTHTQQPSSKQTLPPSNKWSKCSPDPPKPPNSPPPINPTPKEPDPPIKTGPRNNPLPSYTSGGTASELQDQPLVPGLVHGSEFSPRNQILSPSILDFPSLVLSQSLPSYQTRLTDPRTNMDAEASDRQKEFYCTVSGEYSERFRPRLLPLFPVTSPRVSGSS